MNKKRKDVRTHAEEIMWAVATILKIKDTFSRKEIRDQIGIENKRWMKGYSSIFQGMRKDQPGGAPNVGRKYRNVFRRIKRGIYTLTDYGKELLEKF